MVRFLAWIGNSENLGNMCPKDSKAEGNQGEAIKTKQTQTPHKNTNKSPDKNHLPL